MNRFNKNVKNKSLHIRNIPLTMNTSRERRVQCSAVWVRVYWCGVRGSSSVCCILYFGILLRFIIIYIYDNDTNIYKFITQQKLGKILNQSLKVKVKVSKKSATF